jgi:hypothetical protein
MEPQSRFGGGPVEDEMFTNDDSVFQLLDHAYHLMEDGENPMKVIRMAMFIAILEMYHLDIPPNEMKRLFETMADKFLKNLLKVNTQINHGEE